MSLSNQSVVALYNGNGSTTAFAVPGSTNSFSANSEIKVVLRGTDDVEELLVLTTDYTLSGGTPATTVNMLTAPATGEILAVYRESAATQGTDFIGTGPFNSEANESALDKLTRLVQELKYHLRRIPKYKLTSSDYLDAEIEDPEEGAVLVYGANGAIENGPSLSDIEDITLATAVDAAEDSAAAAAISETNAAASAAAAAAAVAAAIDNTALAASWDGDTSDAPTKNATYDALASILALWKNLFFAMGSHGSNGTGTSNTHYMLTATQTSLTDLVAFGVATSSARPQIHIDSANFPTIGGKAPKFKVRAILSTNDVAPGISFTVGLYLVSRPATSGTSQALIFGNGGVVVDSTVAFTTPAADGSHTAESAEFDLPANGVYMLGVHQVSGTLASQSVINVNAELVYHNA